MTDFPEMTIATDSVDTEMVEEPRRWNITFIRRFMVTFGLISSVFDYLTFGVLLLLLHASKDLFRTAWFVESVISASIIVLIIRSRRPFFKSIPGKYLSLATATVVCATLLLPFAPLAALFRLQPLPVVFLSALTGIIALYIFVAEIAKKIFYAKVKF
jgi:Mg2+-importing ATPase